MLRDTFKGLNHLDSTLINPQRKYSYKLDNMSKFEDLHYYFFLFSGRNSKHFYLYIFDLMNLEVRRLVMNWNDVMQNW